MKLLSITTATLAVLFMLSVAVSFSEANLQNNTGTVKNLVNGDGKYGDNGYVAVKSQDRDRIQEVSCDGTQQRDKSRDGSGKNSKSPNGKNSKGSGNGTKARDGSNCDGTGPKSSNPGGNSGK